MQQTRTQSLVSRERERARECEARRGGARGILGSLRLDPQSRGLSLFLLPSDWVRVWEYSERRKAVQINRFFCISQYGKKIATQDN